jgi:hypothetical protein
MLRAVKPAKFAAEYVESEGCVMGIVFIWALIAGVAAMVATNKGRSGKGWFFAGVLFGPIAIVIVLLMRPLTPNISVSSPTSFYQNVPTSTNAHFGSKSGDSAASKVTSLENIDSPIDGDRDLEIANQIVTRVLGGQPMNVLSEDEFTKRLSTFREKLLHDVSRPGVVGNIIASNRGLGGFSAGAKADKRSRKGIFTSQDRALIAKYCLESERPKVRQVADFQRKMGWSVTSWDPVTEANNLGR